MNFMVEPLGGNASAIADFNRKTNNYYSLSFGEGMTDSILELDFRYMRHEKVDSLRRDIEEFNKESPEEKLAIVEF